MRPNTALTEAELKGLIARVYDIRDAMYEQSGGVSRIGAEHPTWYAILDDAANALKALDPKA